MTNHEPPHSDEDESHTTDGRYADITTEDGLLVYDRDNETAWIQSDETVALADAA